MDAVGSIVTVKRSNKEDGNRIPGTGEKWSKEALATEPPFFRVANPVCG